jgi:integrase
MYVVKQARFPHEIERFRNEYLIYDDKYEKNAFYINRYLRIASYRSVQTGKQYAYKICKFLNYLKEYKGKDYKAANNKDICDFFYWISFGNDKTGYYYVTGGIVSQSTLVAYHGVLVKMYRFLDGKVDFKVEIMIDKKKNAYSFYYGQVWSSTIGRLIDDNRLRSKDVRNHIKWYSTDERKLLLNNLGTLRDKAIFSISCDGLRIGEILSLRLQDYEVVKGYINLYSSKGKMTGKVGISVPLSNASIKLLDDYIFNERDVVVGEMIKKGKYPEALFINVRHGKDFGDPVTYRNYLQILKKSGLKSGFNEDEIRTHSGRSTAVMDMVEMQTDNQDQGITMNDLMQQFRWQSPTSIQPYINTSHPERKKKIVKKIEEIRGNSNGV